MHLLAAAQTATSIWPIIATVASLFTGIVGSLVIYTLRSLKAEVSEVKTEQKSQAAEIKKVKESMAECKIDCDRHTVSKEDWVRAEGFTRKELKDLTAVMNRLDGKLDVINKLPDICAEIAARTTERVLKEGKTHESKS